MSDRTTQQMLKTYSIQIERAPFMLSIFNEMIVRNSRAGLDDTIERLTRSWTRRLFGHGNALLDTAKALRAIIDAKYPNLYDTDEVEIDIVRGAYPDPAEADKKFEDIMNDDKEGE